jgi:hypothetical protein
MFRRPLWIVAAFVLALVAGASPARAADPVLVPIFDGRTLDGWTMHAKDAFVVKGGAIHSQKDASRGWIYYNKQQYKSFRWIFKLRQVSGNHKPTVLIWGKIATPPLNGLGAIQFQPPNGGAWDYRPGHNNGGGKLFTKYPHPSWDVKKWAQCEILANGDTGIARMACCPLPDGAAKCKAQEVLKFEDKKEPAGREAPLAIQIHNKGIEDEYKDLVVESPVADPTKFITT